MCSTNSLLAQQKCFISPHLSQVKKAQVWKSVCPLGHAWGVLQTELGIHIMNPREGFLTESNNGVVQCHRFYRIIEIFLALNRSNHPVEKTHYCGLYLKPFTFHYYSKLVRWGFKGRKADKLSFFSCILALMSPLHSGRKLGYSNRPSISHFYNIDLYYLFWTPNLNAICPNYLQEQTEKCQFNTCKRTVT